MKKVWESMGKIFGVWGWWAVGGRGCGVEGRDGKGPWLGWEIGRAWSGRHERLLFLNRHAFGQGKLVVPRPPDRLRPLPDRLRPDRLYPALSDGTAMGDERLLTPQPR